jgi:hypothetical protein
VSSISRARVTSLRVPAIMGKRHSGAGYFARVAGAWRSSYEPTELANLVDESLGLLEGDEVAALVGLGPIADVREPPLRPWTGWTLELPGKIEHPMGRRACRSWAGDPLVDLPDARPVEARGGVSDSSGCSMRFWWVRRAALALGLGGRGGLVWGAHTRAHGPCHAGSGLHSCRSTSSTRARRARPGTYRRTLHGIEDPLPTVLAMTCGPSHPA